MGCTPCGASVGPQGNCLSLPLGYLWECLSILGGLVSFAPSLGKSLASSKLFGNALNIYSFFQLKPDKIFKRTFFKVVLWLEVDQIGS